MSEISLKSITGITSITTPTGVDNQLTLHNNNTTEAVKLDAAGNVHINNQLEVAGVSTFTGRVYANGALTVDQYIEISHYGGSNFIKPNNGALDIITGASTNIAKFQPGGGVDLYFNGTKRFETENTGVTVTGDVTLADSIIHDGDTDTKIRFPSNDQISFETGGSERGRFDDDGNFLVGATGHGNAGAGARKLVLRGPSNVGLTINSSTTSGIYRDCSIYFGYGTSTADMARGQLYYSGNGDFFHMSLDGSAYTMAKSFRLAKESARFDSTPTTTNAMSLIIKSHKSRVVNDNNGICFLDAGDHTQGVINVQKKSTTDATSDLVFRTSSGQVVNTLQGIPERVRITSDGYVTKPYQIAWALHGSGQQNITGGAKLNFNINGSGFGSFTNRNQGGVDTSNSSFTAPVTGLYSVTCTVFLYTNNNTNITSFVPRKNGTEMNNGNDTIFFCGGNSNGSNNTMSGTVLMQLNANDEITVHRRSGEAGTSMIYLGHSHFSGFLVG